MPFKEYRTLLHGDDPVPTRPLAESPLPPKRRPRPFAPGERVATMKSTCTQCQQRWLELEQSAGIGVANYAHSVGSSDPTPSPDDMVRHHREHHEVEIGELAAKIGLRYVLL
jgi:hypothetical protein